MTTNRSASSHTTIDQRRAAVQASSAAAVFAAPLDSATARSAFYSALGFYVGMASTPHAVALVAPQLPADLLALDAALVPTYK